MTSYLTDSNLYVIDKHIQQKEDAFVYKEQQFCLLLILFVNSEKWPHFALKKTQNDPLNQIILLIGPLINCVDHIDKT